MARSRWRDWPRRFMANRPLHFLLGGLLLSLIWPPVERVWPLRQPLSLDTVRLAGMRAAWLAETGQPPTDTEMQGLVGRELDDEILFREALDQGLQRSDPVVRQRLARNMRFLGAADAPSDDALVEQALALRMYLSDIVVRRRLVQIMEFSIENSAGEAPVDEAELRAMFATRIEELRIPARWQITQLYFSADRRGADAERDAGVALRQLQSREWRREDAFKLGDPFLGGQEMPRLNAQQLAGQFGVDFANGLAHCAPLIWCGPITSSYGSHLVWVDEIVPASTPAFDEPEVRKRLQADVLEARRQTLLAHAMSRLRRRYGVTS